MSTQNGNGAHAPSLGASDLISIGQACKLTNSHPNTLRKYANSGQLPCYRVNGGKRRFLRADLAEFFGLEKNKTENVGGILAYCRVSTGGQAIGYAKGHENDLKRQVDRVTEFCEQEYGTKPLMFAEIGSAMNYRRKKFNQLLRGILNHEYDGGILVLENKDRGMRFAFELLEVICEAHGIRIVVKDRADDQTYTQELQEDLLAILAIFNSRHLGARSAKRLTKHLGPEALERILALRQSGMAIARISDRVNKEGFRTTDGCAISVAVIRRHLQEKPQLEKNKAQNSIERYYCDCIERGDSNLRLKKIDIYNHYLEWCRSQGVNPVSRNQSGRQLLALGVLETKVSDAVKGTITAWQGIKIRGERLAFTVIERPRNQRNAPVVEAQSNFIQFYNEQLKGKFVGQRKELDRQYLAWCEKNNVRKISLREIPKLLLQLGNHFSTNRKGYVYDLRLKNSEIDN